MVKTIKRRKHKNKSKRKRGGVLSSIAGVISNYSDAYTSKETRAQRAKNFKIRMNQSMKELNSGFPVKKTQ